MRWPWKKKEQPPLITSADAAIAYTMTHADIKRYRDNVFTINNQVWSLTGTTLMSEKGSMFDLTPTAAVLFKAHLETRPQHRVH